MGAARNATGRLPFFPRVGQQIVNARSTPYIFRYSSNAFIAKPSALAFFGLSTGLACPSGEGRGFHGKIGHSSQLVPRFSSTGPVLHFRHWRTKQVSQVIDHVSHKILGLGT
jgi:hypothetical protein